MNNFFYDLNKRMAALADKQDLHESKVAESEKWIQKAVNPAHKGDLHKALHVAQGEKIPKAKIEKATHSKNPKLRHMAQFAKNVAKEDMTDEGNAFTGKLASTPKGGKFELDGKEFTDTSGLEEKKEPRSKGTAFDKEHMDQLRKEKEAETHSRYDVQDTGYSKRYTRKHEDDVEKDDEVKSDEPKRKGRPKSTKPKGDEHVTKGSYKYKMVNGKRVKKEKADEALDTDGVMMTRPSNMSSESMDRNEYDAEGDMAKGDMHTVMRHARELETHLRDNDNLPTWIIEKLGQIKGMMSSVTDYILSQKERDIEHETGEEGIRIAERSKSQAQAHMMAAAAHNPKFAKKVGMKQSVAKEFNQADKGKDISKLPKKVKKTEEGAKPDFLDVDKDGNKKETFKKAVADKKDKDWTPERKAVAKKKGEWEPKVKEEKVDETTSGSVATATPAGKSNKGGMQFGKGVYESINQEVESLMESMNVSVNMTQDEQGEPRKSITVTADGEQAEALAQLLKSAGIEHQAHSCDEELEENELDWPTDEQTLKADPELNTYAGGLNGPKSTGQTTVPVVASQLRRQASMEESVKIERSLFKNWQQYKG